MSSPLLKGCAISAIAIAICLMINGAHAESYGSDTPSTGISAAKPKEGKVRIVGKQYVVHPNVSTSRKREK